MLISFSYAIANDMERVASDAIDSKQNENQGKSKMQPSIEAMKMSQNTHWYMDRI